MNNAAYAKKLEKASKLGFDTVEEYEKYLREEANTLSRISLSKPAPKPAPVVVAAPARLPPPAAAPGHVGIMNCGMSCFMNSIIQMLYNTYEFRTGLLALAEDQRNSEPYLTLYNIFSRLEEAKQNRRRSIKIDDLLTYLFECTTTYTEATYAASDDQAKKKRNRNFKELGVQRGYFTAENLETYSNPSYNNSVRKAFLDAKLARNIAAISATSESERAAQESRLRDAKNLAEANIEASLSKYRGRKQQDASEFLTNCILYKKRTHHLVKLFTSNDVKVTTGLFNEADLPENRKAAVFTLTDEDGLPQKIYNLGLLADGRRKKMTAVLTPEPSTVTSLDLTRDDLVGREIDLQDLINPELREVEYRGLNIPKVGNILSKEQRSGEFRFTPTNIQQKDGLFFPPEQKYWITSIKRFIHNWETDTQSKNDREIKLNKEITVDNTIIRDDGVLIERVTFELVGMVMHSGDVGGGHYWYMWKEPSSKNWIEFNDSTVTYHRNIQDDTYVRLSTASDINKEAYILLWKRKTGGPTPTLESIRRRYAAALPPPPPPLPGLLTVAEKPKETAPEKAVVAVVEKPKETSMNLTPKTKEEIQKLLDEATTIENDEQLFEILKELSPSVTKTIDLGQIGKRKELLKKLFGKGSKYITRLVNAWDMNGKSTGSDFFFKGPPKITGYTRSQYAKNKESMKGGKRKTQRKQRKH